MKFFTILLILIPIFTKAQAVYFKSVKIEVLEERGKVYYDVIAVTFFRGEKVGYDLYTHQGNPVNVEVRNIRLSKKPIDPAIIPTIERRVKISEEQQIKSQNAQKGLGIAFIALSKLVVGENFW